MSVAVMNLLMAMMVVHGSRVDVGRVRVGIGLRWGHIVNLSLLLDNLELDSGLNNLHVVHGLVSVRRNDVLINMLHWMGVLLVAVCLLLFSRSMLNRLMSGLVAEIQAHLGGMTKLHTT